MSDESSAAMTAADKLKKEPLDRLLGRLSDEQRQALAFQYADRAIHVVAPRLLQAAGGAAFAARVQAVAPVKDAAAAGAARDAVAAIHKEADAARLKEESAAGGLTDGPATRASNTLSYVVESVKASLGEGGFKVNASGGAVVNGPKAVVNVAGVPRALIAGRYILAMCGPEGSPARDAEEYELKLIAQSVMKARKSVL